MSDSSDDAADYVEMAAAQCGAGENCTRWQRQLRNDSRTCIHSENTSLAGDGEDLPDLPTAA